MLKMKNIFNTVRSEWTLLKVMCVISTWYLKKEWIVSNNPKKSLQFTESYIQINGLIFCAITNETPKQTIANESPITHTQVVVNKICSKGRLFVFTASIHACAGIGRIHREDICADTHELGLTHQLTNGWSTGGKWSGKLFSGHPCLRSSVSGQLCLCSVLLKTCGDSSLRDNKITDVSILTFQRNSINQRSCACTLLWPLTSSTHPQE